MNLLGSLRVRLTAETEDFRRGLESARGNLNTFEKGIKRFQRNTIAQIASVTALAAAIKSSLSVANEYDKAQSQLAATAKLTGTALGTLQAISQKAQEQFSLNTVAANGFTIELTKLAGKAGNLGQASAGLAAFLDLGAARGLNAEETLNAVRMAILGADEGTDRLFSKNPSVLYAEFAATIGTTAGKLTDQQKAQALLNAAMQDGAKVQGEYQRWLESSQGQQFLLAQSTEQVAAVLGKAVQPALVAVIPLFRTLAGWVADSIKGWRMLGASLALIPALARAAKAALTGGMAAGKEEMRRSLEEWKKTLREIDGQTPIHVPVLLDTNPGGAGGSDGATGGAEKAGRKAATLYFDGLKDEFENLRYSVALKSIELTGTDSQRLALEEEHALRLLDIERQRLEAQREAGDLTAEELAHGLKEIGARQEIARARRREMEAVGKQLEKQQHILDLAHSVGVLFPEGSRGPGAGIGSDAATVLNDKLDLSGKLATKVGGQLGEVAGGLVGSMLLPGIGGMLGGAIGSLFGRKKREEQKDPVIKGLDAIERAQRETIQTIQQQTDSLLRPENRLLNLPSSFNVPNYSPNLGRGSGGTTINQGATNVSVQLTITGGNYSPEEIKRYALQGVNEALANGRRNSAWS